MREDICSVPVSEVFDISDGCPMCRMRNIIEQRLLDYILGAAMMEPDVRIMTNKEGFCHRHFRMMASRHSRLPLALIIESHLAEVKKDVFGAGAVLKPSSKGKSARAQKKGPKLLYMQPDRKGDGAPYRNRSAALLPADGIQGDVPKKRGALS